MRCERHPGEAAVGVCRTCGRGVCAPCKVVFAGALHCKDCVESGRAREATTPKAAPVPAPLWVLRPRLPPPWYAAPGMRILLYAISFLPLVGIVIGLVLITSRRRPDVLVGRRCLALGVLGIFLLCPLAFIVVLLSSHY